MVSNLALQVVLILSLCSSDENSIDQNLPTLFSFCSYHQFLEQLDIRDYKYDCINTFIDGSTKASMKWCFMINSCDTHHEKLQPQFAVPNNLFQFPDVKKRLQDVICDIILDFFSKPQISYNQIMSEANIRELYLTQKIKNLAFNIKYKAIGYLEQYKKQGLLAPNEQAYILGTKFSTSSQNVEQTNIKIYQLFTRTVWITYRSGFPQLPNEMDDSYVTDTGWGCMIRVGQMLFAQLMRNHLKAENKTKISHIIGMFNDCDQQAIFSIQNVARIARLEYGLKPGAWYNPSQITFILNQLFQKKRPEEYSDMKIKIFNSGNLFFDQIIQKMAVKKSPCKCQLPDNEVVCEKCYKCIRSVAVVILIRLGLDKAQPKYLKILNNLMESEHFQGVIGGKPEKALYFVGRQADQYIYLDPHYVQEAKKVVQSKSDSYFCGSFRKCRNTSIDPSLGIAYYFKDLRALNRFYHFLNLVKIENREDFFIFTAKKTPSYAREKPRKISVDDDDYFEEL